MCAAEKNHKPNAILSMLQNKCPRCRRGNLYQGKKAYELKQYRFMKMNERCPVCGQIIDLEVGFYYGTGYVSYALSIALCVATFIAWWLLIGFGLEDNRIFWWFGFNVLVLVLVQPLMMRLSRTIWLWFFVRYSPDWKKGDLYKAERVNDRLKNAW